MQFMGLTSALQWIFGLDIIRRIRWGLLVIFCSLWACDVQLQNSHSADTLSTVPRLIIPTVYNLPVYDVSRLRCDESSQKRLLGSKGQVLAVACAKQVVNCARQGTCILVERSGKAKTKSRGEKASSKIGWYPEKRLAFNFVAKRNGEYIFRQINLNKCKTGFGSSGSCLNPLYSVAADMRFHKPGEVIYVPDIVGTRLPNGDLHDGYFVIKDSGGAIKGRDRFDFYLGIRAGSFRRHPFVKLGLGDKRSRFAYHKISGLTAQVIRDRREYYPDTKAQKIQAELEIPAPNLTESEQKIEENGI